MVRRQLITEAGIRGQVLKGCERSPDGNDGLDNAAIKRLEDAHLVRSEQRRGATWFELAHDRLIAPVRADNAAWFKAHLSTLQRRAALWEDQKRPDGLLLQGEPLAEARSGRRRRPSRWSRGRWVSWTPARNAGAGRAGTASESAHQAFGGGPGHYYGHCSGCVNSCRAKYYPRQSPVGACKVTRAGCRCGHQFEPGLPS